MSGTNPCFRIGVVAIGDCLELAVTALVEVIDLVNRGLDPGDEHMQVDVLSTDGRDVRTRAGRRLAVDGALGAWSGDVVVCTGVPGDPVVALDTNPVLVAWLASAGPRLVCASVGSGAFFLAEAGLLAGRRATTDAQHGRAFMTRYPDVVLTPHRLVVAEEHVVTAGAGLAAVDLALHLVELRLGAVVAAQTAKAFAVDKNRTSQAPYAVAAPPPESTDELVARVRRWLEQRHAKPEITLDSIAAAHRVTSRVLESRFVAATGATPMDYLRDVRIEAAKRLLESTRAPLAEVTTRVGYRDARSFARLFRARAHVTPDEYRDRFGLA